MADGVLANDSDVDSATFIAVLVAGPSHGALTLQADGAFGYTPDAGFSGPDTFTYQARSGAFALSNVATVTITVDPAPVPNRAPVAVADSYTITTNANRDLAVLVNDDDADGDALTPVLTSGPVESSALLDGPGTVTLNPDNTFKYDAPPTGIGTVTFTYKVTDGLLESGEVTVTITIENPTGGSGVR